MYPKYLSPDEIRKEATAPATKTAYSSGKRVIKKWIRDVLEKKNDAEGPYINTSGQIDVAHFTPAHFDEFIAYKRPTVQVSTLRGYHSAMHDVYRELDAEPPTAFSGKKSTTLYAGLRRMEATENQTTGPRHSGKQPLSYSTYEELCRRTLARDDGGFTHLFLTAQWNLVCRSVSVESLSSQHVVSADDAISCIFYKTKTDQEGRSAKTHATSLRAGLLFPGFNQKKRFGAALKQIISVNETSDYGTHSIRKGAATFACSGNTTGPSVASICSRCDWSLGSVLDRYLRYDDAGDQYIGRLVAGLAQNSADFAALLPHFRDNVSSEVIACIRDTFPALAREKNMKPILKLCLASLTFHAAFLKSSLPKTHPLMSCALSRDPATLQRLQKQLVITGPTWMRPTGIPPYVHMFTKIEETRNAIDALKAELLDGISKMLDARALGGSSLTTAAMKDMFREVLQDAGLHNTHGIPPSTAPADLSIPLRYPMMWGGGIHLLPEHFEFPSVDCLAAWKLWWFGNTALAYPPFGTINTHDLSDSKARNTFYEWRSLMRRLIDGIEKATKNPMPRVRSEAEAERLYAIGMGTLTLKKSSRKRRHSQITATTVLKLVRLAENEMTPNYHRQSYKPRNKAKQHGEDEMQ